MSPPKKKKKKKKTPGKRKGVIRVVGRHLCEWLKLSI
jgi:hypothetical protein